MPNIIFKVLNLNLYIVLQEEGCEKKTLPLDQNLSPFKSVAMITCMAYSKMYVTFVQSLQTEF